MHIFKQLWLSIFLGKRFYRLMAADILLFVLSYFIPLLFTVSLLFLGLFLLALILDISVLFSKWNPVSVKRILPDRLSNGEENIILWLVGNRYPFRTFLQLVEEFPEPWQIRDFKRKLILDPDENSTIRYNVRPNNRGEFFFGDLHIFIKTPLQILLRRKTFAAKEPVKVYPAFLLLRQFEFKSHITDPGNIGFKQVRKTGHSLEFEQIREYVSGDDIRGINWKATGTTGGQLMINVYSDEKSQQVYCIIDKGRAMKMAFEGLSLLDYAVNATLALSAVAISKQDRSGFISFGDKGGDFLPANHRSTQMTGIVNALYNLNTQFLESDFAFLHKLIKTRITQRSLLILFTNFESLSSLRRQLPYLRNISGRHLLLVVFFENTSLQVMASGKASNIEGLYEKVIAEKFILEKKLVVKELQRYGISSLLTAPEKLSVDVINKYLQIKARREI
ncbi:MAG TPA: DUF58 domain-containing protein [Puia sp.]|jgi:uncharacterized protein (DUF58 family)|nr:DUF58 domain-containing protein [Puia sp.]